MSGSEVQNPDATVQKVSTETLAELIREKGSLSPAELLEVFEGVLDDLESAHAGGQLHLDITSARIVRQDGRFRLTGFGAGKLGTVRYMSPERCSKGAVDVRSDIYSLGVVLYEAATGRVPFDIDLRHECMEAHLNRPPDPPRLVNPAITPELERVILRALVKNPAGRYQNVAELRRALVAAVGLPAEPRVAAGADVEGAIEATRPRRSARGLVLIVPLALAVAVAAFLFLGGERMPDLRGRSLDSAREVLARLKVKALESEEVDDTLPAGTVVGQVPPSGTRLGRTTAVKLLVSRGRVTMPDLRGQTVDEATALLARYGTKVIVETAYSDQAEFGTVAQTRPDVGQTITPQTRVLLTVSGGRATCPKCRARREPQARFCIRCGYRF